MYLSIVIPCFNEARIINNTILEVRNKIDQFDFEYEIIIVDDGSTDEIRSIVNQDLVRLISYEENKGKGYAVQQGVKSAIGQHILFMDADHTISIDHFSSFNDQIQQYDIVIASKYLGSAEHISPIRKYLGFSFSFIRRLITGLTFKDTQCGFKLFKSRVAKDLFEDLSVFGWCFDVEILIMAKKRSFKVLESSVRLEKTIGGSQIHLLSSSFRMLIDLIKIRLKHIR